MASKSSVNYTHTHKILLEKNEHSWDEYSPTPLSLISELLSKLDAVDLLVRKKGKEKSIFRVAEVISLSIASVDFVIQDAGCILVRRKVPRFLF